MRIYLSSTAEQIAKLDLRSLLCRFNWKTCGLVTLFLARKRPKVRVVAFWRTIQEEYFNSKISQKNFPWEVIWGSEGVFWSSLLAIVLFANKLLFFSDHLGYCNSDFRSDRERYEDTSWENCQPYTWKLRWTLKIYQSRNFIHWAVATWD